MALTNLPQNDDFDRFIEWLRGELARRGDPLIGDIPTHKDAPSGASEGMPSTPPLRISEVEALAIGRDAGSFVLTGAPDLATFEPARIERALEVLHELAYSRYEGTKQAAPLRAVFVALAGVQRGLKFGYKINRARGPQKVSLRAALDTLPALIADQEGSGGEYWRGFCRQALAEARAIWEG